MKYLSLFLFLFITSRCFSQTLESDMDIIIKEYPRVAFNKYAQTAIPHVISLGRGIITTIIPEMTNKRTGTMDSDRGELLASNNLLIFYDVGFSSGAHMSQRNKPACTWYGEKEINGRKASIGVKNGDEKIQIVVTIYGGQSSDGANYPANFWADVRNAKDIRTFLDIALSYKGKQ